MMSEEKGRVLVDVQKDGRGDEACWQGWVEMRTEMWMERGEEKEKRVFSRSTWGSFALSVFFFFLCDVVTQSQSPLCRDFKLRNQEQPEFVLEPGSCSLWSTPRLLPILVEIKPFRSLGQEASLIPDFLTSTRSPNSHQFREGSCRTDVLPAVNERYWRHWAEKRLASELLWKTQSTNVLDQCGIDLIPWRSQNGSYKHSNNKPDNTPKGALIYHGYKTLVAISAHRRHRATSWNPMCPEMRRNPLLMPRGWHATLQTP